MRLSIVALIAVLAVGSAVILLGFLTNQEYVEVSEITNQIEKLEIYKNELDKINQLNLQMLEDLEAQIINSDNVPLEQINDEIDVIKQVINENKAELEQIIKKLSEIEPES
jgi:predicted PurR-regulated permease PerM